MRTELIDRTLIWNERQLRRLLEEYVERYNSHHYHRSLHQRAPGIVDEPHDDPIPVDSIQKRPILSGLINEYHQAA